MNGCAGMPENTELSEAERALPDMYLRGEPDLSTKE
jgi:hypothetical protein